MAASPSSSNAIRIPFDFFRLAARVDGRGTAVTSPSLNVLAPCAGITFYGQFFRQLGYCNPDTDVLTAFGGAELAPLGDGVQQPPSGVGTVAFTADAQGVTATLTGSTLRPDTHSVALLLVDATTGRPISLDYGFTTSRTTTAAGVVASVRVPVTSTRASGSLRAYLMVDAYPAARGQVTMPDA